MTDATDWATDATDWAALLAMALDGLRRHVEDQDQIIMSIPPGLRRRIAADMLSGAAGWVWLEQHEHETMPEMAVYRVMHTRSAQPCWTGWIARVTVDQVRVNTYGVIQAIRHPLARWRL